MYGPEERVIPFNRGIEFFPDARSSRHRQGAHDSAGLNPPSPQLAHSSLFPPQRKRKRREKERGWPHPPSSPLLPPPADNNSPVVAEGCPWQLFATVETSRRDERDEIVSPPPIHLPPPPSLSLPASTGCTCGCRRQKNARARRRRRRAGEERKKAGEKNRGRRRGFVGNFAYLRHRGGWPRLILLSVCARRRKKALPRGCD